MRIHQRLILNETNWISWKRKKKGLDKREVFVGCRTQLNRAYELPKSIDKIIYLIAQRNEDKVRREENYIREGKRNNSTQRHTYIRIYIGTNTLSHKLR